MQIPTQGVTFKLSAPGSPSQLLAVIHITGFQIQASAPEIDVTDLDSVAAELITGVPKYGVTLNFNLDPDNARHQEMRDAIKNRTKIEGQFALTDTTPSLATFEAYVTAWQVGGNVNDKVAGSITLAVNKGISWA